MNFFSSLYLLPLPSGFLFFASSWLLTQRETVQQKPVLPLLFSSVSSSYSFVLACLFTSIPLKPLQNYPNSLKATDIYILKMPQLLYAGSTFCVWLDFSLTKRCSKNTEPKLCLGSIRPQVKVGSFSCRQCLDSRPQNLTQHTIIMHQIFHNTFPSEGNALSLDAALANSVTVISSVVLLQCLNLWLTTHTYRAAEYSEAAINHNQKAI